MATRPILDHSPSEYDAGSNCNSVPAFNNGRVEDDTLERLAKTCLQTGDSALWTDFFRLSQPFISRVIARTLRTSGGAATIDARDDLVQETYLKLCSNNFKALRKFTSHHEGAFRGFLKVIARNMAVDYIRGFKCGKRGRGEMTESVDEPRPPEPMHRNSRTSLEQRTILRAIDEYLASAAQKTGRARDYVIFWLHYQQGLCAKAIALLPGIDLNAKGVESALVRLTHRVRSQFNPETAARKASTALAKMRHQVKEPTKSKQSRPERPQ